MQLPAKLIDYVLVHELAHLHKRDHSSDFRTLVGTLQDYRERRDKLDQFGALLRLLGPVSSSKKAVQP
jgi:predicted metal-dependent hydrolase